MEPNAYKVLYKYRDSEGYETQGIQWIYEDIVNCKNLQSNIVSITPVYIEELPDFTQEQTEELLNYHKLKDGIQQARNKADEADALLREFLNAVYNLRCELHRITINKE